MKRRLCFALCYTYNIWWFWYRTFYVWYIGCVISLPLNEEKCQNVLLDSFAEFVSSFWIYTSMLAFVCGNVEYFGVIWVPFPRPPSPYDRWKVEDTFLRSWTVAFAYWITVIVDSVCLCVLLKIYKLIGSFFFGILLSLCMSVIPFAICLNIPVIQQSLTNITPAYFDYPILMIAFFRFR